jgi:hypothetical protein
MATTSEGTSQECLISQVGLAYILTYERHTCVGVLQEEMMMMMMMHGLTYLPGVEISLVSAVS